MIVVLLAVVVLVIGSIHWYLWKRLVKDTTAPGRWRRVGTGVAIFLALLIPVTMVGSRMLPHERQPILAWPGFMWLALMFYLLVTLALLELPRLALRPWARRSAASPSDDSSAASRADDSSADSSAAFASSAPSAATPRAETPTAAADSPSTLPALADTAKADAALADAALPDAALADAALADAGPAERTISTPTSAVSKPTSTSSGKSEISDSSGSVTSPTAADSAAALPAGGKRGFDPSRRLLLGRSLAAAAGALSVGAVGIGTWQALGEPQLKRVPIRLPKLPASMNGFRIALVSDIHLGPLLGRSHTERIVRIINSVDADVVAVVGDLVDGSVAELGAAAEPLQDLRARHGSFFVTGNHEYFSGHEEWIDEVDSLGLRVLRNERVDIQGLDLAGVNDVTGAGFDDGPDFAKTLGGRDPARPVVLLAHQPVQAHDAAKHGVDLQLSGHTHGGQMVPFNLLVALEAPVVAGLGEVDGTQVYVTRGAGFWGPPVRFGAPPDISVVELHGA